MTRPSSQLLRVAGLRNVEAGRQQALGPAFGSSAATIRRTRGCKQSAVGLPN
jgi:hypothetical protein